MKTRIRFIVARLEASIDSIADTFNNTPYTEKRGIGISSRNLGSTSLSATFIEKRIVIEEIKYPTGDVEQAERIKYVYIDFEIIPYRGSYYLIKIGNPPASLKSFIAHIGELFPSLSIEKYKFDLKKFYKTIKGNKILLFCKATSLKASSVPFSEKSVARIEVISENDAYQELKKIYGEKAYSLDRLIFSLSSPEGESELTVASTGAACFDNDTHKDVLIESFVQSIDF